MIFRVGCETCKWHFGEIGELEYCDWGGRRDRIFIRVSYCPMNGMYEVREICIFCAEKGKGCRPDGIPCTKWRKHPEVVSSIKEFFG